MTGCLLFAAKNLIFFITGKNKADVVRDILDSGDTGPAAYVAHHAERVELFLDAQANGGENVYLDVPLSRMLTMENNVKQMPPKPASTRAGTK